MLTSELKRKMASRFLLIFLVLLHYSTFIIAQKQSDEFSLLFYNVENLFDVKDDSLTADENFTPEGDLHWTYNRLEKKCLNISKTIIAAGGWKVPDVIVLCEVENRYVIDKLIKETPLRSVKYKVIHKESPDFRGIDVALLYNPETIQPIEYHYSPLFYGGNPLSTREMLYFSGVVGNDTLHVFGNHWPSRYSGFMETQGMRNAAAMHLKTEIENVMERYSNPKIVVVGDFNENPEDKSISEILMTKPLDNNIRNNGLYNFFSGKLKSGTGTLKYQSQWFLFDQIIVSGSLLNAVSGLFTQPENASIVNLPFLLTDDEKFGGKKPFRTYYGFDYQGGFSDHLPVIIRFGVKY